MVGGVGEGMVDQILITVINFHFQLWDVPTNDLE